MNNHSISSFDAEFHQLKPVISIVVPTYNEEKNINRLLCSLLNIVHELEISFEIIIVDDGSRDKTCEEVIAFRQSHAPVKLVRLSRNFGKEAALNAGIFHASGKAVIQLDADMQHPPEIIREFIKHWREGFEIVYGQRKSRADETYVTRLLKRSFYTVFAALSDVKLMEGLGDFLLMDRKVVDAMLSLPERERFTKGLYAWVGFSRKAVPFEVNQRENGVSGWSFLKLFSFGISAITSFGTIPLRIWSYIGLMLAIPSFGYGAWIIIKTILLGIDVPGYASLMVAVCFFSGVQLFGLGIMGEYLGRVLTEVKQRPLYLVQELVGFQSPEDSKSKLAEKTEYLLS